MSFIGVDGEGFDDGLCAVNLAFSITEFSFYRRLNAWRTSLYGNSGMRSLEILI